MIPHFDILLLFTFSEVPIFLNVATSHYPMKLIESCMKDWLGGSHLVLEAAVGSAKLYAGGYKYCRRKTLCFIFNHGAPSTGQGVPDIAKYRHEDKYP